GSTSSLGGNSLQEEFALGDATRIIELEVFWPKTAATQRFPDVPLDTRVRVREDRASLEVVDGTR
ncbi:MAG: ASPIC/UnbV domain-containing protein, partial [Planctomycetota bacterium]